MPSHSAEDFGLKKLPPSTRWKEGFSSERGGLTVTVMVSLRLVFLQERSSSVCYELMGRDERSKAAMQINHLSVPQWERRQEISLEHNHMAIPFNSTQSRRGWWGVVQNFWWKNEKQKCNRSWLQNFGIPQIPNILILTYFSPIQPFLSKSSQTSFSSFLSSSAYL